MNDLTIIFYTCNRIDEGFAQNIRNELFKFDIPIISVSHKPIDFGKNICVEGLEPCIYNVYRQVLIGAKNATTEFVACAEDDCLYHGDHFAFRPSGNVFYYNANRWRLRNSEFLFKHRTDVTAPGMWNCIAPTELMIETLGKRFEKYPLKGSEIAWGEPGRYERKLGLSYVEALPFKTDIPNITFAHDRSLGGSRRIGPNDIRVKELPFWGNAQELRDRMWDG